MAQSSRLGDFLTRSHTPTAPSIIRNFVLLQRGERCDPLRRAESERILRAMPFISDASITAYQDGTAGVRLEVVTVDEPAYIGNIGVSSASPYLSRITLGNSNFVGQAFSVAAHWSDGGFYRDHVAFGYIDYQIASRPVQLELRAARRSIGDDGGIEISHPFLTDFQRAAWRVSWGRSNDFASFRRPSINPLALE